MPKMRTLGWVGFEYDDGIQSVHFTEPDEFHETVRRVPLDLIAKYQAAQLAADRAGKELLAAWSAAPERKNPKHKPEADE